MILRILVTRFLQRKSRFPQFDAIADSTATKNLENKGVMKRQGQKPGLI